MTGSYWQITIALCFLILITRGLPFLFASYMKDNFNKIGKLLPAYIMLLLVIYEIDIRSFTHPPYGLPAIFSLLFLTVIHLWLRNTFVSLATSTVLYIGLIHYFQ
ncbi:branched-chain amino acid transporter permease [Legionella spiritensis]|uniref:branched-chain amino acid transporter permease n=1 Tax=Legionella spiritensis TaxID=452 RepID=UPI000F70E95C|nr:AzlD domain-containing protein [Legionella spiritensis]VEG90143.1 Branched-chain amino acid transport protein (AzlD) [Legionella spiritensis]